MNPSDALSNDNDTSSDESLLKKIRSFFGCLLGFVFYITIAVVPILILNYIRAGVRRGKIDETVEWLAIVGSATLVIGLFVWQWRHLRRKSEQAYQELREIVVTEHGEGSQELRALDEFARKIPKSERTPKSNTERAGTRTLWFLTIWAIAVLTLLSVVPPILKSLEIEGITSTALTIGMIILMVAILFYGPKFATGGAFRKTLALSAAVEEAVKKQDYATAIALSDEMIASAPGFDTQILGATGYLQAGQWEKGEAVARDAMESLGRAVERSKDDKNYRTLLGSAQTLVGVAQSCLERYAEAEALFVEAIKNNPEDQMALSNYAEVLLQQRKSLDVVLQNIEKVEAIDRKAKESPKATPIYLRAWLMALQGHKEAALQKLTEAHTIAAASNLPALEAEVFVVAGKLYEALGEPDKASRSFSKARSLDREGSAGRIADRWLNAQ